MINTITAGAVVPDAAVKQRPVEQEPPVRPKQDSAPAPAPKAPKPDSDLRLVIERDSHDAYYVYRLVDRTTGKIVVELPREHVSELGSSPSYEAGNVVSTKA
jgi:flagellar protein FlaG